MKLKLTGKSGKYFLIDVEDWDKISMYKWTYIPDSPSGHVYTKFGKQTIYLHRFLLNPSLGVEVDHLNGDGLDNRRSNLRLCTRRQNSFNKSKLSTNTSGYTGIGWSKHAEKWRAEIQVDKKNIYLGYYKNIQGAWLARRFAERLYFKEFARHIIK